MRLGSTDVLGAFRAGRWEIVHVDNHATHEPYVFYADDPIRSDRYITDWAGGAAADEGPEIERWVLANAPGIPSQFSGSALMVV